jgi:HEAT repeat protein
MQAALLRELGDRGDVAAKPAVLAAAKSDQEPVRVAALGALAGVGEAADALVLAQTAAATEGRIRDTARASLDRMVAKGADEAMQTAMAGGEIKVRLELIRALGARHAPAALPAIMKAAEDADAGVRVEAMRALEAMADEKSVDLLVRLITSPKQDNEREPAERALAAVCARAADKDALAATLVKALGGASGPAKAALLRPLARLGGEKAFAPVRAALGDADAGVKDTAIRVVAEWPDDAALEDMIALAKSDPKESNQVLALRGYLRLARERERKEEDRLKMAQVALPLAKRPDEQKQVLGVLRDLRSIEALRLAAPLMSEEKVKGEAIDATVRIARQIGGKLPDEVKGAMEQAIKLTTDERIRREAGEVLKKIEDQQKK